MDFPDTPEGVALVLFWTILKEERPTNSSNNIRTILLDLFAACLAAATGERSTEDDPVLH